LFLALLLGATIGFTPPALADSYKSADFSGAVLWPTVPNSFDGLQWGDPVSGNFVYDVQMVPGSGSGFVNVFPSNFPDIATIPDATLFTLNVGSLTFHFSNSELYSPNGIQYNNGAFNGFACQGDFTYNGSSYQFNDQGGTWTIYTLGTFNEVAYGYINSTLSNVSDYTPPAPISATPEPGSMLLFGVGLAGLALVPKVRAGLIGRA
jgi:hypothetical protein